MKSFDVTSAVMGAAGIVITAFLVSGMTASAWDDSFVRDCMNFGKVRVKAVIYECKRIADEVKP